MFELFETGFFVFPIYEHRSARRIVRYLLIRGIVDEEIADAIEDSTANLHLWLNHHGKNMVGEWVIAWMNECRMDYKKEQALEIERTGYVGAYADITPELSYYSDDETTSDDDEMRTLRRGPLRRQTTASTVELASSASRAGMSTTHELSHQGSVETELEWADDSDGIEDQYLRESYSQQIPTITYSHSHTNGDILNISDSDDDTGKLWRDGKNRSFNKEHFREVVRYRTREKLKKLTVGTTEALINGVNGVNSNGDSVSDDTTDSNDNYDFPPPPPPAVDDSDTYSETFEYMLDNMDVDTVTFDNVDNMNVQSAETLVLPKCDDCQCTIPHYGLKLSNGNGDITKLDYDYLELQKMDSADSLLDLNVSDNTLRAMRLT